MPFSGVIGHEKIITILRRSLAADRMSHAYLFHGVDCRGIGDTALALVQAVFCGGDDGCGSCPSCRKVAAGRHPDLHLVRPDGAFIKIDQIRELQKELSYRPFEAPVKACIIEDADRMNPAAANSFLKTLEEPPGDALLILLTSHLEGVLPTILSRCQLLRFPPLSAETMAAHLRTAGAGEEEARMAAALSGGSLARAEELLAGDLSRSRRLIIERVCGLKGDDIITLFAEAEELGRDRESALGLVEMLELFWRDVLMIHAGRGDVTNTDLEPLLRETVARTTTGLAVDRLEMISRIRRALTRNVNPRLAVEVLFMNLAEA